MKRIYLALFFLLTSFSVFAADSGQYAECAGYMQISWMLNNMQRNSAPPYAQEKYKKRAEYFLQGGVNLEKMAGKQEHFNKSEFDNIVKATVYKLHSEAKNATEAYVSMLNDKLFQCLTLSGLNSSDFPQ